MPLRKLLSSRLRINMASSLATTVVNLAVTGIGYPVYLHFLGYERYGVWLVLATIINFVQLTNLGLGSAVMKLVAEEHAMLNHQGVQRYVATAITALILSGTLALLVILGFATRIIALFNLKGEHAALAATLLPCMGILSVYVFVVQVLSATLSGLGRMDLANYADSAGRLVALLTSVLLLVRGGGLESLLIANAVSYLITHGLLSYLIGRCERYRFFSVRNLDRASLEKLLRFGGGVFGGSLVSMLFGPFNKLVISRWVGVGSVPLYEIAFNGSMQIRSLIEAVFRALSPEISRLNASGDSLSTGRIQSINQRAVRIIWLAGAPFWAFIIIFAAPLLQVWLGTRFDAALPPVFKIMMVGTFVGLLGVPAFYILMGLGNTRQIFLGNLIQSGINALLVVALLLLSVQLSINYIAVTVILGVVGGNLYLVQQKNSVLRKIAA